MEGESTRQQATLARSNIPFYIMGYAVFTCAKGKGGAAAEGGLSAHIERQIWDAKQQKMVPFMPKSVIHPELTELNKEYILPPGMSRSEAIEKRIKEAGITRKIRKDQVRCLALLFTSDKETMDKIVKAGRADEYADACIDFARMEFGDRNVVSAVAHYDETTFHLHVSVVPIVMGQAAERPDTKKQHEARKGKAKRSYKKQEVDARLCAKEVFTPEKAERWQDDLVKFMHERGFEFERGVHGSKAKHVNPADYNAAMAELNELNEQKNTLEDSVLQLNMEQSMLQTNCDMLDADYKQKQKTVKGLTTMIENLETKRAEAMANGEADVAEIEAKIADKQAKLNTATNELSALEAKVAEQRKELDNTKAGFAAKVMNVLGAGDLAKANETIKAKDSEIDNLKKRCNAYARKYNTDKAEWDKAKGELERELQETKNSLQTYIAKNIDLANDLRMTTGRQSFIANQSVSLLNELTGFSADSIAKVREIAFALILGNGPVYIPCSSGGSVSSHDGWRGKDKDEDDYLFRLRCWLHAGKVVKSAYAPQRKVKMHR